MFLILKALFCVLSSVFWCIAIIIKTIILEQIPKILIETKNGKNIGFVKISFFVLLLILV